MTQKKWIDIREIIFPIGYVYISMDSTSPSTLFGGKWTPIKGVFPYFNQGTGTGGNASHSHSIDGYAKISFRGGNTINISHYDYGDNDARWYADNTVSVSGRSTDSESFGDGAKIIANISNVSNLPPYQEMFAWKRVG